MKHTSFPSSQGEASREGPSRCAGPGGGRRASPDWSKPAPRSLTPKCCWMSRRTPVRGRQRVLTCHIWPPPPPEPHPALCPQPGSHLLAWNSRPPVVLPSGGATKPPTVTKEVFQPRSRQRGRRPCSHPLPNMCTRPPGCPRGDYQHPHSPDTRAEVPREAGWAPGFLGGRGPLKALPALLPSPSHLYSPTRTRCVAG